VTSTTNSMVFPGTTRSRGSVFGSIGVCVATIICFVVLCDRIKDRFLGVPRLSKNADEQEIDAALQFTRDTYATVGLGVGRIQHFDITTADANGRDNIDNDAEAAALTTEWTIPNDAMDIFFVLTYAGDTIGRSAIDGPCDKNAGDLNGSVVAIEGAVATTGFVLAHEAGHYLGLSHVAVTDTANLMNGRVPNGGNLTADQGTNMRDHCFVRPGC
jgi:Metallo-peptidase family M12B Reprolysin-like